jgi:cytochrome c peroxidase
VPQIAARGAPDEIAGAGLKALSAAPMVVSMELPSIAAVLGLVLTTAGSTWFLTRSEPPPAPGAPSAVQVEEATLEPLRPVVAGAPLDPAKVALGARLFGERRLSRDGTIACATCHDLDRAGADPFPRARGIDGAVGARNTPTVYNAWLNPTQFWDGHAASLEAQITGPLTATDEMGATWPAALATLAGDPDYARAFAAAYGAVTRPAVEDALATFERSLSATGSRFDRFLRGDAAALTAEEAEGYRAFKSYGCASCHQGANVGGNMFQRLGVLEDYVGPDGGASTDLGRYKVTGRDEDRHRFRVPSLRLAALTPPYFHDGSVATLEEAVRVMARYQLGREIGERDERLIVLFLRTLPGELVHGR